MIVVSDTSPLNYLVLISAIHVLPQLFGEIHVPSQVLQELQHPSTPASVKQWVQSTPTWLVVRNPSTIPAALSVLDAGEAHAIALAQELHASGVLIDERKGRRIAKEFGFKTLGTVTILELAAQQKLLDLRNALIALKATSFHISDDLIKDAIARSANPAPGKIGENT